MTKYAKSGEDYGILIDLSESLLKSQVQCSNVEYLFRKDNKVVLKNNKKYEIQLESKNILKVSLTLNNYGTLHQREIVTNYLKHLINNSYGIIKEESNKEQIKRFDEFEKNRQKLNKIYVKLSKIIENPQKDFFNEIYFCNYNIFKELLKKSNTVDELAKNLNKLYAFTLSSLDLQVEIYNNEYENHKQIITDALGLNQVQTYFCS